MLLRFFLFLLLLSACGKKNDGPSQKTNTNSNELVQNTNTNSDELVQNTNTNSNELVQNTNTNGGGNLKPCPPDLVDFLKTIEEIKTFANDLNNNKDSKTFRDIKNVIQDNIFNNFVHCNATTDFIKFADQNCIDKGTTHDVNAAKGYCEKHKNILNNFDSLITKKYGYEKFGTELSNKLSEINDKDIKNGLTNIIDILINNFAR